MRLLTKRRESPAPELPAVTRLESIPDVAFELAIYRMRYTDDTTHDILSDYMRELGA